MGNEVNQSKHFDIKISHASDGTYFRIKAGERGEQGRQNTWGPDWFGGPEILIKHLVIALLSRGLGARNA